MKQRQTRDLLIRNLPEEIYLLLEKTAKEHHRSKTQEAIVALTNGLSMCGHQIKEPIPFKWKKKISTKFIEEAIKEGRE
jgi:plasmid stability protein